MKTLDQIAVSKTPAYYAAWHQKNRARRLAAQKERYRRDRADQIAKARKYNEENPQTVKKSQDSYRAKNRKMLNEKARQYSREHPDKRRTTSINSWNKRRAKKRETVVDPLGIRAWMKEIRTKPFVRCHWCGTKVSGRKVHFDHVIALSKGGGHTIGNLCASCPDCNLSKSARAITEWLCGGQTFLAL